MTDESLRDRSNSILLELTERFGGTTADKEPALRHLGIAGLNLSTEADIETLLAAADGLRWLAIYLGWERDALSADSLIELIEGHDLAGHLGPDSLRRRIAGVASADASHISRSPHGADPGATVADLRSRILCRIADDEHRLEGLFAAPDHRRADLLIEDAGLLASVLEICADPQRSDSPQLLSDLLPNWPVHCPSKALEILARFEQLNFERSPSSLCGLSDRSQRFEQSLCTHLDDHQLLGPIRIALAFAPRAGEAMPSEKNLRQFLARFAVLARDPALTELTMALMTVRHRVADHLRGAIPLSGLESWVDYLRGPCADLSESRHITLREATNFAHYAFHLLNICDLGADPTVTIDDPLRRSMMDIEEELKEFALVGQRQGLTDSQSDLHRFEKSRWRNDDARALLADRLTRLCGGWRKGHRSGPPGSPPRPNHDLYEICLALVGEEVDDPRLDATSHLIGRAHFQGHRWLDAWTPGEVLDLLVVVLAGARNAASIDTDSAFVIDFSPLADWVTETDSRRRSAIVHTLLGFDEVGPSKAPGLLEREIGLRADTEDQRVTIDFSTTDELDALLTLLANSAPDDPLVSSLTDRLHTCLESAGTNATDNVTRTPKDPAGSPTNSADDPGTADPHRPNGA